MKNILFIIAMLSILANCKKNQPPIDIPDDPIDTTQNPIDTPIIELGKSFVLKNGVQWNVPFNAWYHTNTHARFRVSAKVTHSNLIQESYFLQDIPAKIGRYAIEYKTPQNYGNYIPESTFIMMYEYDQPIGDFMVDTTRSDHFVEVIRYDSVAKTVEGRFQVFLGKKPTNVPFPGVPDSIFMTEGRFHLKIQDP
jgi:hypothetical protein